MKDSVFQIEERYPEAKDIMINGEKVWPFIRIMFRYLIVDKNLNTGNDAGRTYTEGNPPSRWLHIKSKILPNFRLWFTRHDVVIFSNSLEKRKLGDAYIDKLSEGITRNLNPRKVLTVNYLSSLEITIKGLGNKHSVDGLLIDKLTRWRMKFTRIRISEKDKGILTRIVSEYGLDWGELETRIRYMLSKAAVIKLMLRIVRPKLVFTSCYSYYAEVWAARQRGIKTVELQHGIISPLHPGYESLYPLNKDFTADHLFTFGSNSLKGLDDNVIIRENAFKVGNYYLELMETRQPNEQILNAVKRYQRSVCVPTDYFTERPILEFIIQAAKRTPEVVYLIVPRSGVSVDGREMIGGIGNIHVITDYSFQDVVRHCTFHTATNSTCCLEALAFGIPNILIDQHNASELFNDKVDPAFTKFVKTTEEYLHYVRNWNGFSKAEIKASNANNFAIDYSGNLGNAINKIGVAVR